MNYVGEALEVQRNIIDNLVKLRQDPFRTFKFVRPSEVSQWGTDIAGLSRAQTFYWNKRTTDIVKALMPAFKLDEIIASRHLPFCDYGFCWFADEPLFTVQEYKGTEELPLRALSWYVFINDNKPYLGMSGYATIPEVPCRAWPVLWACTDLGNPMSTQIEGSRLNFDGHWDERTQQELTLLRQFVCAAGTFLRQKFLSAEREIVERHGRKRLERSGYHGPYDVSVVQLRRPERKPTSVNDGEPKKVDWNWQWTVAGHTKQQWYPSLGEHLPVYIHPYVKGSEDKPMKPRSTPLFAVTR